jgi:hypothetical protein
MPKAHRTPAHCGLPDKVPDPIANLVRCRGFLPLPSTGNGKMVCVGEHT